MIRLRRLVAVLRFVLSGDRARFIAAWAGIPWQCGHRRQPGPFCGDCGARLPNRDSDDEAYLALLDEIAPLIDPEIAAGPLVEALPDRLTTS